MKKTNPASTGGVELSVSLLRDSCGTGNFEITCDGVLLHSKQGGQGFIDSQAKLDAVMKGIASLVVGDAATEK